MKIWKDINGNSFIQPINMQVSRIVEDQSRSTTRKLVDSIEEHEVLEALLEQNKPKLKFHHDSQYFKNLHYLLWTPFRYPPLQWGSRFGSKLERSLLYASVELNTAMNEVAFYRLSFLRASEGDIGGNTTTYTAFRINVNSEKSIDLTQKPFRKFSNEISSKTKYTVSQILGKDMREDGVECFQYQSARDPSSRNNVGVFSPICLLNNYSLEKTYENLRCYSTKETVEFSFVHSNRPASTFDLKIFLVDGQLPLPVT